MLSETINSIWLGVLSHFRNIVILTGAGISQESGIPTFRSEDGLWEQHRVEDVATPEGYIRDPDLVHRFYNRLRKNTLVSYEDPQREKACVSQTVHAS